MYNIVDLLENINPYDSLEDLHIKDTSAWINSGGQIFRVSKPANHKHLVSYFVVLDEEKEKILLVSHKKAGL